ncbi:MAG: ABC transporter ATP-binding protein/permease, partial [Candidatus Obscuribacterales bacterium]|nr:ABC transporter ATP-binding protein/permease [Candidatus Obscuribacterales bacterium]
ILVDAVPLAAQARHGEILDFWDLPWSIFSALCLMAFSWFAAETLDPAVTFLQEELNDFLTKDINLLILDKINSVVDIAVLENPKFYDQLQRVQNDLTYKPVQMLMASSNLFRSSITLISLSVLIVALNPWLLLLIIVFCMPKLVMQLKNMYESWAIIDGDVPEVRRLRYYSNVLTNNSDAKEVRLFGLGGFFRKLYLDTFVDYQNRRQKIRRTHLARNTALAVLSSAGSAISYAYAVVQAVDGKYSVGTMSMYLSAIAQSEGSLASVTFMLSLIYQQTLFVNRLFEFLEISPAIPRLEPSQLKPLPMPLRDGIEFKNVSFRYPDSDRLVLDGLSFKIKAGQTVALVGENGAGKTTIVKLLSRFYDPTDGQILVDGIDLRELDPDEWRRHMSVVFQDYSRFQMTVRENIGVGQVQQIENLPVVEEAAARGGASNLVAKLSERYETMLGKMFENNEVGTELSGGEWQKIALARAFMRSSNNLANGEEAKPHAQLLILDEPTASLDVQSEYDVYCRFHELTRGTMALLITHRFSTVRIADVIFVVENGKLIEEGTHEQLIATDTNYSRLYNLQAERYR